MRIAAIIAILALFAVGVTTTHVSVPVTAAECDPNYTGACVPVNAGDVNCDQIKAQVKVVGKDIYNLDGDGNGLGCESYAKSSGSNGSLVLPTPKASGAQSGNGGNGGCSTIFVAGKGVIESCSQGHSEASRVYPRKPGVPPNGCANNCPSEETAKPTPEPEDKNKPSASPPTNNNPGPAPFATPVPSEFTPPPTGSTPAPAQNCDRVSYPDICVPSAPPFLSCSDIPDRNFRVRAPDPHHFDADGNGIGCEEIRGPSIGR